MGAYTSKIEKEVISRALNSDHLKRLRKELENLSKEQIINVAIISEAVSDILVDRLAKAANIEVKIIDLTSLNLLEILETTYSSTML